MDIFYKSSAFNQFLDTILFPLLYIYIANLFVIL